MKYRLKKQSCPSCNRPYDNRNFSNQFLGRKLIDEVGVEWYIGGYSGGKDEIKITLVRHSRIGPMEFQEHVAYIENMDDIIFEEDNK